MKEEINPRFLRLKHIIGDYKAIPPIQPIIPVAKSTWWDGVKKGKYPKPYKIGNKTTVWKSNEIQAKEEDICKNRVD